MSLAMPSFLLHFTLLFIVFRSPALGATCQPRALSLPFKNNPLSTNAVARGVLWQIGGPIPQNVVLSLSGSVVLRKLRCYAVLRAVLDTTMIHICGTKRRIFAPREQIWQSALHTEGAYTTRRDQKAKRLPQS
jgi:hypothetical protein